MIGPDGRMNDEAGELAGLTQEEAEARILEWIKERGLLEKREAYRHAVALCERCKTTDRAARSRSSGGARWRSSKKPALEALRSGRVRYHPESQHRFAIDSLENCARLEHLAPALVGPPASRSGSARRATTTVEETRAGGVRRVRIDRADAERGRARHVVLVGAVAVRDPRLAGANARARAPGTQATLNTTAREIIRLWENRMIFSGLELMGEVPFRHVIIHTTLLAPDGRRMSKSLGTGIESARPRRRARRRRDALRPPEDVLIAGRPLLPSAPSKKDASSRTSSGTRAASC